MIKLNFCQNVRKNPIVLVLLSIYGGYTLALNLTRFVLKLYSKHTQKHQDFEKDLEMRKSPDIWNTVLFFPDKWTQHPLSPTSRLTELIDSARVSIHVCMYNLTFEPLLRALQWKYKEGTDVKVVIFNENNNTHIPKTRIFPPVEGAGLTLDRERRLMHHKFIIIDNEAVLTGSLNWTHQGIQANEENVLVSTDPRHVEPFVKRFAELWDKGQTHINIHGLTRLK